MTNPTDKPKRYVPTIVWTDPSMMISDIQQSFVDVYLTEFDNEEHDVSEVCYKASEVDTYIEQLKANQMTDEVKAVVEAVELYCQLVKAAPTMNASELKSISAAQEMIVKRFDQLEAQRNAND